MGQCIFIVGGARSGKSDFAQDLAEKTVYSEKYFLATCPIFGESDRDMAERVERHKQRRQGKGWQTVEEELHLGEAVADLPEGALVLIDCLTLWVSNLLYAKGDSGVDEQELEKHIADLLASCQKRSADVLMVSGEVGGGVIPENALARCYRDLVGRCNQTVGRFANSVYLVTCGIPTQIKGL